MYIYRRRSCRCPDNMYFLQSWQGRSQMSSQVSHASLLLDVAKRVVFRRKTAGFQKIPITSYCRTQTSTSIVIPPPAPPPGGKIDRSVLAFFRVMAYCRAQTSRSIIIPAPGPPPTCEDGRQSVSKNQVCEGCF